MGGSNAHRGVSSLSYARKEVRERERETEREHSEMKMRVREREEQHDTNKRRVSEIMDGRTRELTYQYLYITLTAIVTFSATAFPLLLLP